MWVCVGGRERGEEHAEEEGGRWAEGGEGGKGRREAWEDAKKEKEESYLINNVKNIEQ